jgi:hypothetical protein
LTPEGCIKADCLRYLNKRGIKAWNNTTGCVRIAPDRWLHFGLKGSSDILGCLPGGRFLAVETKALRGRLTDEQRGFLRGIESLGGVAVVARSFQELDAALRREGYADFGPLFAGGTTA